MKIIIRYAWIGPVSDRTPQMEIDLSSLPITDKMVHYAAEPLVEDSLLDLTDGFAEDLARKMLERVLQSPVIIDLSR